MVQANTGTGFDFDSGMYNLRDLQVPSQRPSQLRRGLARLDQLDIIKSENLYGSFALFTIKRAFPANASTNVVFRMGREQLIGDMLCNASLHNEIKSDFKDLLQQTRFRGSAKVLGGAWIMKEGNKVDLFFYSGDLVKADSSQEEIFKRAEMVKELAAEMIKRRFPKLDITIHSSLKFFDARKETLGKKLRQIQDCTPPSSR